MKFAKLLWATIAAAASLAAAAPAALASPQFMAEEYPATWSGEQVSNHVFGSPYGPTVCESAKFTGSSEGAQNELQLTPEYTGCTTFSITTEVDMNGCEYNLDQPSGALTGTLDIVCPGSEKIEISVSGLCKVKIGPQTNISGLSYANSETWPTTVTAAAEATGIDGERSGLCGSGTFENGTYTGSAVVSAESESEQMPGAVGEASIGVPAELKFVKKDETLSYEIKNNGTVDFQIRSYRFEGGNGKFEAEGKCLSTGEPGHNVIKAGKSCVDQITCKAVGNTTMTVRYTYGEIQSALKC